MEPSSAAAPPPPADPTHSEGEPVLGKRAQRRAKRAAYWDQKKEKKKQQKKVAQAEKREHAPPVEIDMSEEAVLRRRERATAKRETYLMASEEGLQIVIDCGFEEQMTEKEKKSLSQQIMFSYGVNRRRDTKESLMKISGFEDWLAFKSTPLSYVDTFKKESLVYLTADSPNTVTQLDKDKVYIIGGIVDRNRLKGATYNKAIEQGIATARLPLDEYLQMGSATRVLTVNHVFEILVRFGETHDWKLATLKTLPSRKGVEVKDQGPDAQEPIDSGTQ